MKLLRNIKRATSPKRKEAADKATLEEAQEQAKLQILSNGRHPHAAPQLHSVRHKNTSPKTSPRKDKEQLTLDLNANNPSQRAPRTRTRRPTKSPNRSSLKDDSEAGKARRRERRRCVSVDFADQLEVRDIVPQKDLVNPKTLWWQNTEYQTIAELSCAIVDLSKVDKSTETRGLEDLIRKDHAATTQTRQDVLMAQRILRQRQMQDDEALGSLYQTKTAKYLQEAALRANQDEKEVQNYLADTRRMVRRTWSV